MRKLKCHRGSASILFIGITFALLCLTFLLLELGSVMERYDYALDVLQRSVNSAVEKNMLDEYRSDRILKMDPAEAEKDFRTFAAADMPDGYEVHIQSVSAKASSPEMEARGTLTIPTLFSQYGIREKTYSFTVRATNYDLD